MKGGGLSAQMGKVIKKKAISAKLSLAVMLVGILILIITVLALLNFAMPENAAIGSRAFS